MTKSPYYDKVRDRLFELSEEKILYQERSVNWSTNTANISECHRKKTSGYKRIGKLTKEGYNELIEKFKAYHKKDSLNDIAKVAIKKKIERKHFEH